MNKLTPLAANLGEYLKARGDTIAVAESSAGGLTSASLLSISGASAYFVGGADDLRTARHHLGILRNRRQRAERKQLWRRTRAFVLGHGRPH